MRKRWFPLSFACISLAAASPPAQTCGTPGIDLAKGCWGDPFRHLDQADGVGVFSPDGTEITDPTQCIPGWPLKRYIPATPPYADETSEAVHMSVIPKGIKRGWMIVWGGPIGLTNPAPLSLLPNGFPPQGRYPYPSFLGLDPSQYFVQPVRQHQYSIFDPENPDAAGGWMNFCFDLPPDTGDFFCSGHAWTADGNLLVVGGTIGWEHARTPQESGGFEGSKLCYLWIPPEDMNAPPGGTWIQQPDLDEKRWYPSVAALGPDLSRPAGQQDLMAVLGGIEDGGPNPDYAVNSYQVWMPSGFDPTVPGTWKLHTPSQTNTWPSSPVMLLENYPRAVLFSSDGLGASGLARLVFGGWPQTTDLLSQYDAAGPSWLGDSMWQMAAYREYGSMCLLPIVAGTSLVDRALVLGGLNRDTNPVILSSVEQWNGHLPNPTWNVRAPMPVGLWAHNAVLTPDGRLILTGGERSDTSPLSGLPGWTGAEGYCSSSPNYTPFEYDPAAGDTYWRTLNAHQMIRDYHSTAVLTPDGKILVGGGDHRKFLEASTCPNSMVRGSGPWDYELYTPYYLALLDDPGRRPVIVVPDPTYELALPYGQDVTLEYTFDTSPQPGFTIDRVVLMRPGSVTHHNDGNQRLVQLNFVHVSDSTIRVTVPTLTSGLLPRGIYMMFFLSLQNGILVPSKAEWAKVS